MRPDRLDFLKKVARHFQENPGTTHYYGVSKEICFSVLSLHFSTPKDILDPTDPRFLSKAQEKISQFEENLKQGSEEITQQKKEEAAYFKALRLTREREGNPNIAEPHINDPEESKRLFEEATEELERKKAQSQTATQTPLLSKELDQTTQDWQEEVEKRDPATPLWQKARIGNRFAGRLEKQSLISWGKIKPDLGKKIGYFLKRAKFLRILGGVFTPITTALISFALVKKAIKYFGGAIYALYSFFSALGVWALAGAIVGSVVGGIAGGIGGALLGFKLGLLIGAPLLAIPVVGWILYGITVAITTISGFIIGALGGAAIGTAVGGAIGYAAEHWLWQPAQNLWTGAGSLSGGAGNFFAGLWSGFWTGAGNFLSSAFSWASGAIGATSNFIGGLFSQLSGISIAQAATVPVFGTVGIAAGGTFIVGTTIVGTAFMRQPAPVAIPPLPSEYFSLTKSAAPSFLQNSDVEGGKDISYTITLTATKTNLTNVRVTEQTTKTSGGGASEITIDKNGSPIGPWVFPQISQGQAETITYQIHADSSFKDSTVTNVVTALADIPSEGRVDEKGVAAFTIYISDTSLAGSCGICNLPGGFPLGNSSLALQQLLVDAGNAYDVPAPVLAGIMYWEGRQIFGYPDGEVVRYSLPGAQDPTNCTPNGCGARGPMQFLNDGVATDCGSYTGRLMPDTWGGYADAVNITGEGRSPNVCNIKDAVFAAAKMLRTRSGAAAGCGWTIENVYAAGSAYYGSCSGSNAFYCDAVWQHYQTYQCP